MVGVHVGFMSVSLYFLGLIWSHEMATRSLCASDVKLNNQDTFCNWHSFPWWFYLACLMSLQLHFTVVLELHHKSCNQFDDGMIAVHIGGGSNVRLSGSWDSRASYFLSILNLLEILTLPLHPHSLLVPTSLPPPAPTPLKHTVPLYHSHTHTNTHTCMHSLHSLFLSLTLSQM